MRDRDTGGILDVTEPQRLTLYRAPQAALGEEEGNTLMALTPPSNADIAIRPDIALSVAELPGEILRRLDVVQLRIIAAFIVTVTIATLLG